MISLVPSLTETLFDLGAGDSVVAVTNYCIFPETSLPRVGGTKNPRVGEIRALRPDLVYVNIEENLPRHSEAIARFAPVFATYPTTVAGVVELLGVLGAIHQQRETAARLSSQIDAARGEVTRQFSFAVPIWKDPWMWCGGDTYVSDLVVSAGGRNLFAHETRYPERPLDQVLAAKPDVVFLPDEPFAFAERDAEVIGDSGAKMVIGPFPGHLFTWHGSRTLLGLRFLREVLSR